MPIFGQDIDKKDVALSKYKGKVLLVVNVASRWYVNPFFGLRTVACISSVYGKTCSFPAFLDLFLSIGFLPMYIIHRLFLMLFFFLEN